MIYYMIVEQYNILTYSNFCLPYYSGFQKVPKEVNKKGNSKNAM